MPNYDLNILQPAEFEDFSRDVLQAHYKVFIESFTDGRDGGIDLRFAKDGKSNIIVQAKRYKDWNSLKSTLNKEKSKIGKLKPSRYILTTSVGLTPENKSEIVSILDPYVKSTEDILGKDDLNNILGLFPDLEKKQFKLWLSSVNVLENILHSSTVNRSAFELDNIREQIKTYVMNQSFGKARDLLNENGVVIISGIPGIGKTTLARMLIFYFLNRASEPGADPEMKNFEELVVIPDSMETAYSMIKKDTLQIFFFDDFLGDITFHKKQNGFDRDLVSFMTAVKRDKGKKLFILSTREHILSEALIHYKHLNMEEHDIPKCVVSLSDYTPMIRARILYNHINASNLPQEYIEEFLKDKSYLNIVRHTNFNPRIIEMFIVHNQWRKYSPEEFMDKFKEVFDRPEAVWEMAFENLNLHARYAMAVLTSMGTEVDINDWKSAFRFFCRNTQDIIGLVFSDTEWKRTLKILHECFIKTSIIGDHKIVTAYNPSVKDFMIGYLQKSPELVSQIIVSSLFSEQITTIFRDTPSDNVYIKKSFVILSGENISNAVSSLDRIANDGWASCRIFDRTEKGIKSRPNRYEQMVNVGLRLYSDTFRNSEFTARHFSVNDLTDENINLGTRLQIIDQISWIGRKEDLAEIFARIYEENIDVEDYSRLQYSHDLLSWLLPDELKKDKDELISDLTDAVLQDIESSISSPMDLEMKENMYLDTFSSFGVKNLPSRIQERLEEIRLEMDDDFDEEEYHEMKRNSNYYEEQQYRLNKDIDALMSSLRKTE